MAHALRQRVMPRSARRRRGSAQSPVGLRAMQLIIERYCQELWIGEAWLGGFLLIFFLFTAFDLKTIDELNTGAHER